VAVVLDLGRARRRAPSAALPRQRLLVLIAGAGVLLGERGDGAYTMNAGGGVAMSVHVRDQPGGSALAVAVRGLPSGKQCTLVAVSTSGQRETAGTWTVTYNRSASVVETSTFPAQQIARLELLDTDGQKLTSVATTGARMHRYVVDLRSG